MYSTTKRKKCPKCGKLDLGESEWCQHCLSSLMANPVQQGHGYWIIDPLQK